MTRSYANFAEHFDADIRGLSAEEAARYYPGLFGLGADDVGDARLAKVMAFINTFPKPPAGKAIRADVLLGAIRPLVPLAWKVGGLADGSQKRGWVSRTFGPGGQGYLTGPTVTPDDKITAGRITYEAEQRLPDLGTQAVHPDIYNQIKAAAYQLLKIGTDIGEDTSPIADTVGRYFGAVAQAWVDLPGTLTAAAQGGIDAAGRAVSGLMPLGLKVSIGGGIALLGLAIYSIVRGAAPYARGYVEKQTGVRGLSGIGVIEKGPDGKHVVCFRGKRTQHARHRERICFPVRKRRVRP